MPNTTHMGWTYPAFRTRPWYDEFVSMLTAIDDSVFDHESRITALEAFVPELFAENQIAPSSIEITANTDPLNNWKGLSIFNTNAAGNKLVAFGLVDSGAPGGYITPGAKCRVVMSHGTNKIAVEPPSMNGMDLPDGVNVAKGTGGLRSRTQGSEIEVLYYVDNTSNGHFRVFIKKGQWENVATGKYYSASTDALTETGTGAKVFANTPTLITPILGHASASSVNKVVLTDPGGNGSVLTILAGKTLTVNKTLTLDGTDGTVHTMPPRTATIKYHREIQRIAAASDTTLTLDTSYSEDIIITGTTETMFVINLGDATTYTAGDRDTKCFRIRNNTQNFVGIINTNLSTFHRLPPRATIECVLVDNSTASGIWYSMVHDPAVGNPAFGMNQIVDFNGYLGSNYYYSEAGLILPFAGAGAVCAITTVSMGGRQGTMYAATGTTNVGYGQAYEGTTAGYFGLGCRACECSQSLQLASTAIEEFIARFGFGDNVTGGAHAEGAYLLNDRGAAGIANWQTRACKTAGGAAATQNDTNIAPVIGFTGAEWQKLRAEVNSAGTRADFFIDNVWANAAGGLTTLPATTTAIKIVNTGITKTVGNTTRYMKWDYLRMQSYPLTPR